ncbi:hypothetical protein O3P69_009642 [Scylla paramamosain]|uniref:Uncharacterized protein n=1 Tax=Scylla paramamosain TaxID=85552 RepID=A0AAW0SWG3_SCYPA
MSVGVKGVRSIFVPNVLVIEALPELLRSSAATSRHISEVTHLQGITVLEQLPQAADVIIGLDKPNAFVPLEVRKGGDGELFAVQTPLGWTINGPVLRTDPEQVAMGYLATLTTRDSIGLKEQVRRLWEQDSAYDDEEKMHQEQPLNVSITPNIQEAGCVKILQAEGGLIPTGGGSSAVTSDSVEPYVVCRVRGVERVTCRAGSPLDVGGVTGLMMVIVEWAVGEVVVIRDFRARKMSNRKFKSADLVTTPGLSYSLVPGDYEATPQPGWRAMADTSLPPHRPHPGFSVSCWFRVSLGKAARLGFVLFLFLGSSGRPDTTTVSPLHFSLCFPGLLLSGFLPVHPTPEQKLDNVFTMSSFEELKKQAIELALSGAEIGQYVAHQQANEREERAAKRQAQKEEAERQARNEDAERQEKSELAETKRMRLSSLAIPLHSSYAMPLLAQQQRPIRVEEGWTKGQLLTVAWEQKRSDRT